MKMKLSDLVYPEKNVRKHPERQIEAIAKSVEKFGQYRPVIVDEDNVILVGNGLVMALNKLGREEVDVRQYTGLSSSMKKKLMIVDNRMFDMGRDDDETQIKFLKELGSAGVFEIPGFDENVIRALIATPAEIESIVADYGKPAEVQPEFKPETMPIEPTRVKEMPALESEQLKCPHCGNMTWVE